ncbi:hypothetical protein BUALT_Bualt13G0100100 [Buddleja alternifolia]|uniref:Peptidase A1 domain-containing protein n=1 Tax=Buddleja alternifolia TaxID=168488 RepID=A0AAV6WRP9_9LAMI|nr:hypothetical protein BUALT_Bualt13G0100100 [Buddleja alternifolia]
MYMHKMSFVALSSMALILLLAFITSMFISTVVSTSVQNQKTGIKATLRRTDSGLNFTKTQLLQRGMKRGRKRIARAAIDVDIKAPVSAGEGDFLIDLSIGTPPMPFSAILDTGSDLIWTQCKPCKHCFNQQTPIFDPKNSSSFSKSPCSSDLCKALPVSSCISKDCEYAYEYGGDATTQGVLATETFTFDEVSVPNLGFGCGLEQNGDFDAAGLVGLGRGKLSLVSQLDEPKFSYCLPSFGSNRTSTLAIGSEANAYANATTPGDSIMNTPLIRNPSLASFYYVTLKGLTVGETLLPIDSSTFEIQPDGSGGMFIDSGTTLTFLEESAFNLVKEEFSNQIKLPINFDGDLELCFTLPAQGEPFEVPRLKLHFQGADLELSPENYFIALDDNLGCLAMVSSRDISVFGNKYFGGL